MHFGFILVSIQLQMLELGGMSGSCLLFNSLLNINYLCNYTKGEKTNLSNC